MEAWHRNERSVQMASIVFDADELKAVVDVAVDAALRRMQDERPRDDDGAVLLDKRTAAKRLGVSVSTLDRLREKKGLPCVKVDSKVLFRPASLDVWAAQNEQIGG